METALLAGTNQLTNKFFMYGSSSSKVILESCMTKSFSQSTTFELGTRGGASIHRMQSVLRDGVTQLKTKLQVAAKLGRGGRSGNNGDNRFRFSRPFASGNSSSPVPSEQQPVNEYQNLLDSVLFNWVVGDIWIYTLKLSAIGATVAMLLGWPVMATTLDPEKEFLKCCAGAICGGLLSVTLATLRIYLGWAYVGNRLFSATVEYEETGWYDGQIWIKPPEVLARDRLLGSYKVKPALTRVKLTLIALAASLVTSTVFFLTLPTSDQDEVIVTENNDEIINQFAGSSYSDESARKFEPDAFANEVPDKSTVETGSALPDYCY